MEKIQDWGFDSANSRYPIILVNMVLCTLYKMSKEEKKGKQKGLKLIYKLSEKKNFHRRWEFREVNVLCKAFIRSVNLVRNLGCRLTGAAVVPDLFLFCF